MVSRDQAQAAWDLLRSYARCADEAWDEPAMALVDNATEALVKSAYTIAARYTHPDRGGEAAKFVEVDRAKHVILEWHKRAAPEKLPGMAEPCHNCDGSGFVKVQRGFRALRMQCPSCYGSGEKGYERDKVFD